MASDMSSGCLRDQKQGRRLNVQKKHWSGVSSLVSQVLEKVGDAKSTER